MSEFFFNMDGGYFESIVRGFRAGFPSPPTPPIFCQCDTLDGQLSFFFFIAVFRSSSDTFHPFTISLARNHHLCADLKLRLATTAYATPPK